MNTFVHPTRPISLGPMVSSRRTWNALPVPDEAASPSRKQEDPAPKAPEKDRDTDSSPTRKQEDYEPDTYKPQRTVVNPDLG